jgi:hypothetical protein
MPRKEKIKIHRTEELTGFDDELDAALSQLNGANRNVVDVLESIETENEGAENADAESGKPETANGQLPDAVTSEEEAPT